MGNLVQFVEKFAQLAQLIFELRSLVIKHTAGIDTRRCLKPQILCRVVIPENTTGRTWFVTVWEADRSGKEVWPGVDLGRESQQRKAVVISKTSSSSTKN